MAGSSSKADHKPGFWSSRLGLPALLAYLARFPLPARGPSWTQTLGGALVVILSFEALTGLLLFLYYQPDGAQAHASVSHIIHDVHLGWLVRSIHHAGAHAAVLVALLHGLTTFVSQSFRAPREPTWWTGLMLAGAIGAFAYSGAILRWDQASLYAAQVGSSLAESLPGAGPTLARVVRGDSTVGPATLHRAFAIHVGILPAFAILVGSAHVYLVHIHGLSGTERGQQTNRTVRDLLPRALLAWLVLVLVVLVIAALRPPALGPEASIGTLAGVAEHPPWYFLAFFHLARSAGGDGLAAILALLAVAISCAAAPVWGGARRGIRGPRTVWIVVGAMTMIFVALTIFGRGG